jgi:predicted dehydrogenase
MTTAPPIALVAGAAHKEAVQALCESVEIAGVMNLGRTRLDIGSIPVFDDLGVVLQHVASGVCCFLTPYAALKRDLFRCVEKGVHVLSAGSAAISRTEHDHLGEIAAKNRVRVAAGGQFRFGNHYRTMHQQCRKSSFGQPVYLRHLRGGGGGLLPAWWAAGDAVDMAVDLLDADLRFLLAAATKDRSRHHLALTAGIGAATAHLLVAPAHLPLNQELMAVGTGGVVASEALSSSSIVVRADGLHLHPHGGQFPEPAWLEDFLSQLENMERPIPPWEAVSLQSRLLRALRRALRTSMPVTVDLSKGNS